jgi:CcmD family protein
MGGFGMTNLGWLVAAYSVLFVLLFAYTGWMSVRQREIERRIEDLRRRVETERR